MSILQAIILAIIEGLTEFLPVSSTGHMILASTIMGIQEAAFVDNFEIAIQLGAILAIVLLYARRFLVGINLYIKLAIAFFPTAVIGFLAYGFIKAYLFNSTVVAISLIFGGIVLVVLDKFTKGDGSDPGVDIDQMTNKNAFLIGLFQCISMIPGVSRAAATIIGGISTGLSKKQAMEFSFLLAVPTMFAATGYDLLKSSFSFSKEEVTLLGIGMIISFVTAIFAVKLFVKLVENYGFKQFGYYRIVIGVLFLLFVR